MANLIELDIECQMNNGDVKKKGGKSLEYSDQVSGETSSSTPLTVSCQDDCSNEESSLESFPASQKKMQQLPASISETAKITSIDEESKTKDEKNSLDQPTTTNTNSQNKSGNAHLQKLESEKSIRIDVNDDEDDDYKPGQIEVGWNTSSGVDSYSPSDDENEKSTKNVQNENDDGTMFEDFPVFEDFPDEDEDEIRITRNETIENQTNIEEEFDSRRPWRKAPLENEYYNYSGTDSDTQTEVTEILNTDFDTTSISGNEMLQMNLYISAEQNIMSRDRYSSGGRTPSDRSTSVSSEITEVKKSKAALDESQFYMNGINRNLPLSREFYENKFNPPKQNNPNPYTPQEFQRNIMRQEGALTLISEDNKSNEGNSDENERAHSELNKSITSINDSNIEEHPLSPRRKNNSQRKLSNTSPKSPSSETDAADLEAKTPNIMEASLNELNEFSKQKEPLLPNKSKHDDKNTSNQNEIHGINEPRSPQYRKMLLVDGQNAPSVELSKRDIIAAGGKEKARSNENDHQKLSTEVSQIDLDADQIQDGNSNEKTPLDRQGNGSQSGDRRQALNGTKGLSNESVSNQSEKNLVDRAFTGFPLRSIRHRGRLERRWPRLYRYRKGFIVGILAFFLVAGTGIVIIQFSPMQESDVNTMSETKTTFAPTSLPTQSITLQPTAQITQPVKFIDPNLPYSEIELIFGQQPSARAGTSISYSGDGSILAIGAPNASGRTVTTGAVYIYKYGHDGYSQLGNSIEGSNTGDEFGWSVSLASDGSRVAIGARSSSNIKTKNGCVKIFTYDKDKDTWEQLGSDLNGLEDEERSGWSVALSGNGNRVAIGGPQGDINSDENRLGSVTVFEYSDLERNWLQLGNVRRGAGSSVSLSYDGNHLVFGVFRSINKNNVTIGHVEVHQFADTSSGDKLWTQIGENIEGSNVEDQIGRSVSISSDGSRIAIGIDGFDTSEKTNVGCCRVFDLMEASDGTMEWIQAGADLVGDMAGEESGVSVSISGNGRRVACGGPHSGDNGMKSGVVRVYDVTDGTWTMVGKKMVAPAGSEFGSSVALTNDGSYLAIGGPALDRRGRSLGGVIRVFEVKSSDY